MTIMLNGRLNDSSMAKLKQLLANRYGKGLELRPLTDLNAGASAGHWLKGIDLHIPLRVQDAFLGTAVVPAAADLSQDHMQQISQVVRMVLEPALYKDYLDRCEDNLRSLSDENLDVSNLKLFGEPLPPIIETPAEESLESPRLISNLVHFHGHDSQRIKKAALLLHEMTGRWAFAPLSDLAHGIATVEDLLRLGSMTLLVEDVGLLDERLQKILVEYLENPHGDSDPLIVTGSPVAVEELHRLTVDPLLRDEISVNCFELDRAPLTEKGLREVLALMFFKVKGEA